MKKYFFYKIFLLLLVLSSTYFVNFGLSAEIKIPNPPSGLKIESDSVPPPGPIPPPGNDSLLHGMTPGNYAIPSGWTLIRTQNFEGTKPTGESWGGFHGSVSTERPHSGTKSIGGTYDSDQDQIQWALSSGITGTFKEIYLSWWDYVESQALWNDEYFIGRFYTDSPEFQEVLVDFVWSTNLATGKSEYNQPSASFYVWCQGDRSKRYFIRQMAYPRGSWVQFEIHYRPNTSTNGVPNEDGFWRFYINGARQGPLVENVNLNGTISMHDSSVAAGGIYTKNIWMSDYPNCVAPTNCSVRPGNGTDMCGTTGGRAGQLFSDPYCNPVDPPLKPFKRFIDDVILMKK